MFHKLFFKSTFPSNSVMSSWLNKKVETKLEYVITDCIRLDILRICMHCSLKLTAFWPRIPVYLPLQALRQKHWQDDVATCTEKPL